MNYIISGKNIELQKDLEMQYRTSSQSLRSTLQLILAHRSHSALRKIDRR